eukprot:SAG22_NODE_541_length_9297_cov_9.387149_9_plen_67_part_00
MSMLLLRMCEYNNQHEEQDLVHRDDVIDYYERRASAIDSPAVVHSGALLALADGQLLESRVYLRVE